MLQAENKAKERAQEITEASDEFLLASITWYKLAVAYFQNGDLELSADAIQQA